MTNSKLTSKHKEQLMQWFKDIGETDKVCIEQVLQNCRDDPEHTLNVFLPTIFDFYRSTK